MFENLQEGEIFEIHLFESEIEGRVVRQSDGTTRNLSCLLDLEKDDENSYVEPSVILDQIRCLIGLLENALSSSGRKVRFEFVGAYESYTELDEKTTTSIRGRREELSDEFYNLTNLNYRVKLIALQAAQQAA